MKLEWDKIEQHVKLTGQVFAMDFKPQSHKVRRFHVSQMYILLSKE